MSGMELITEAAELAESAGMSELLEQKGLLQGHLEAARETGNVEKVNFFRGELAKLEDRLTRQKGGELPFGANRLSAHQG